MDYKLFQRITAKDLCNLEGISLRTAFRDMQDIKEEIGVKKVSFIHYLIYNKILKASDVITKINSMDCSLDLTKLRNSITL